MQRKVTKTETQVRCITVNCEYNDSVDIKCGGASILGFDFYVPVETADEMKKFVTKMLKKYDKPCMSIIMRESEWIQTKAWTKDQIEACVKRGY